MKLTHCECGCGKVGQPAKMRTVRMTDGKPRAVGATLYRDAKSWRVLPQCEQAFMIELRASERCRATAEMMQALPRWRRVMLLPSLWNLRRASLARRIGETAARAKAWGLVWTALRGRRGARR